MGIIRNGILGGFRKKTGTVAGAHVRGQDVIRALPRPSNKPPTVPQLNQRAKFGLVTSFLSLISDWIDMAYKKGPGPATSMNKAVKDHLKDAVIGVGPNFSFDYSKLKFSTGKLSVPSSFSVDTTASSKIDFNWTLDGPDSKYKAATDVINVMVFNPVKQQFVSLMAAAPRSALTYVLPLPLEFIGDTIHCYFSFSSTTVKNLHSKSVYVVHRPVA